MVVADGFVRADFFAAGRASEDGLRRAGMGDGRVEGLKVGR